MSNDTVSAGPTSADPPLSPSGVRLQPVRREPPVPKESPTRPGVTIIEDLDSPYTSPRRVRPVAGAAYGLGIVHVVEGVNFVFERWARLSEGDEYRMWMNGVLFASKRIARDDLTRQRFFYNIPRPQIPLGFIPDVYGEVIRVGSVIPSTSPPQIVFIKDTRPGGVDDRPHEPWHSKLILTLSATLIGANTRVVAKIKAWDNMRVNDLVMFYWGGTRYDVPPITQDQVGQDLEFQIDPDFLALVGSGHYVVQFYLYDEVRNRSGEEQPWSKLVQVNVDLDLHFLPKPTVIQNFLEITSAIEGDIVHLKPVTVEVEVRRGGQFVVGDHIRLIIEGETADGVHVYQTLRQRVDRIPQYYLFSVRNEWIRSLVQSTVTFSYVRERDGEDDLPSENNNVGVYGTRFQLPRPSVLQAVGPFIPPDLAFMTAAMPDYQPPGTASDLLKVVLSGKYIDGSVESVESERFAGNHPRFRDFRNSEYMRLDGLDETNVHYFVTDVNGVRESERAWVQIGRPPRTLLPPFIQEAINGNVDLVDVGTYGTLELFAEFEAGDKLTVQYTGSLTGNHWFDYDLFFNASNLVLDIPKDLFSGNLDGTLTVSYWIDRFDVFEFSEELVVTVGTKLGRLYLPQVLEATTEPDELAPADVWPRGATVRVRYDFIKRTDQVEVQWEGLGGLGSHFEVKQDQSGDYIDFTIPTEVIGFNIHPLGRDIDVSFNVIRNGHSTPSEKLTLRLLTLHSPPSPVIDSIGDSAVLEIPLLSNLDRTRVQPWMYAHVDQRMWLSYEGTFHIDDEHFEHEDLRARIVNATEVMTGIASFTPVSQLRELKDWSPLFIRFWVTFNHSNDINDAVLFDVRHHMIQREVNVFPHPEINLSTPAEGEVVSIEPLVSKDNCQVVVRYPNMNLNGVDRIKLDWIHPNPHVELPDLPPQDGLDGGEVRFHISNEFLGTSAGRTINLHYSVVLGRGGAGNSELQTVEVKDIQPADLPRVLINNVANGGSFNPPDLPGDPIAACPKWELSVTGQRVWMRVTTSAVGIAPLELLTNHPITAIEQANGLANILVSRAWLLSLPDNASFTVHTKVTFDGSEDEFLATPFLETQYRISLVRPLNFDGTNSTLWGRTYIIPGNPNVLPAFNSGNSIRRTPTGGTPGYFYTSSNTGVAVVDSTGLVTVRGNGSAKITVRDSSVPSQTRSYVVSVGGVVLCYGLGAGTKTDIDTRARNQGLRVASLGELRELSAAYGHRWPMGNAPYWSSTYSHNFLFFNYWWARNINTGGEGNYKQWIGNQLLGVGLR
jgi:hypothetical protein